MKYIRPEHTPFVRKDDNLFRIMFDVIIALTPAILVTTVAYGFTPLLVVLVSVGCALFTEFISGFLLYKRTDTIRDGSAIVTGVLLAFTIGPFTPLPIVAFGAVSAILFGKMFWGGTGRNLFNPALMGREFMTIFFPVMMVSEGIYFQSEAIRIQEIHWFDNPFINQLLYQSSGAMGEYSVFFLLLGGIYLLYKRRITWHIPVSMMVAFCLLLFLYPEGIFIFSLGGVFLGAIYMATDMPTSSSTSAGKIYFGAMIGVICVLCLAYDIPRGYLSYAILLMNLFVVAINYVFRPVVWGYKLDFFIRMGWGILLTAGILISTRLIISLHHADGIKYLIYLYIVSSIVIYIVRYSKQKSIPQN